jgi:LAO/AO transport system kinase
VALLVLFGANPAPTGGHDLQGVERGIMQRADTVVARKEDGQPSQPNPVPEAPMASSTEGDRVAQEWSAISKAYWTVRETDPFDRMRAERARRWRRSEVTATLVHRLRAGPALASLITDLEQQVSDQEFTPATAAEQIITAYRNGLEREGC